MNAKGLMHCVDFEERILDELDGGLSAAERHLVETHIATCPACRRFRDEQAALDVRLSAVLRQPGLSPDFRQRMLRRIEAVSATLDAPELREQKRRALEAEFEATCRAFRKNLLNVPNLLDLAGLAAVSVLGGMLLLHFMVAVDSILPKTTGALFQSPLMVMSLIGGALSLMWGGGVLMRSGVTRRVAWF